MAKSSSSTDTSVADHYAVLGIEPDGAGLLPVQRVMCLAAVPQERLRHAYEHALTKDLGNPFHYAKVVEAFKVWHFQI